MSGERAQCATEPEAFLLRRPRAPAVPLVLSSPHSGADYPAAFLAASRLDPVRLRRSEDSFVDALFAAAPGLGSPLISAPFPRAYLDLNREPWELDPAMFADPLPPFVNRSSPRVRLGLGTIARIVASGDEIYAGKLRFAEAEGRVTALYQPYHRALRRLLDDTVHRFGGCLLLDCHSMPSAAGGGDADIVLGDCHGSACAPDLLDAARRFLAGRGFGVAVNVPYAGGFTTDHYGRPAEGCHALQIELNRALYMDEQDFRPKPGFARLAAEMAGLVEHLVGAVRALLPQTPVLAADD